MKTVNYVHPGAGVQAFATVPATSDAKEYLRLLLRHKFGLVLTTLLGLAIAGLYLISTAPTYEASSLVEVRDVRNFVDDDSQRPINWNAPTIKEEANILNSRRVLSPVVDRFELRNVVNVNQVPVLGDLTARFPFLAGTLEKLEAAKPFAWRESELDIAELTVPRAWEDQPLTLTALDEGHFSLARDDRLLIEKAVVGERIELAINDTNQLVMHIDRLDALPDVQFTVVRRSMEDTISGLRSRVSTDTSDSKSRMIAVKLRGGDAAETSAITNAIVEEYQKVKLGSETLDVTAELEFYEASLPQVDSELRAAEGALAEFREAAVVIDEDTGNRLLVERLELLERDMLELQIEKDDLDERYTNDHPSHRRLTREINIMQRKIDEVRVNIQSTPNTQRELLVLEEDVETKRTVFNEMNEKLQKLRIAVAGNAGSVQIWDEALVPKKPVSPNASLAIVGSTLATLFCYLLYLTLRSTLSTVINDQESLERVSGLPVYMNIPKSNAQRRLGNSVTVDPRRLLPGGDNADNPAANSVLAVNKPADYAVESMRGLRSILEDVMSGAQNNVLMITSPLPNMGKSFVSVNLAVLLAQSGKRVLLIDSDYQRGQLHKAFGIPMGPGLPEVIRGKSELKGTVKPTSIANLYCIPRGFMGTGALHDMPNDKEFAAFMHVVAPKFDIAIIDTPPVLSVSTAASLGKHAGSTLMVVKQGDMKEPQLTESLKRLSFSGVQVSGCILNGSSAPTPRHYTYYRETVS